MKRTFGIASLGLLFAFLSCSSSSTPGDSPSDSAQRVIEVEFPGDRGRSEERNPEYEAQWNEFYKTPHDNGDTLVIGAIGDADSLNPLTLATRGAELGLGESSSAQRTTLPVILKNISLLSLAPPL